jgi:hypothetical protein
MLSRFISASRDLDAFLVDCRVKDGLDFEPGGGCGRRDQVDDCGVIGERPAAANSA